MNQDKFVKEFKAARRTGCPFVVVETADQIAAMKHIISLSDPMVPAISWDKSAGLVGINDTGKAGLLNAMEEMNLITEEKGEKAFPVIKKLSRALTISENFPTKTKKLPGTILFVFNGHRFLSNYGTESDSEERTEAIQALSNLRERSKTHHLMTVILCPSIILPEELKHDVVFLDYPLPSEEELKVLTLDLYKAAGIEKKIDEKAITKAVQSAKGLSKFEAEQALAMSLTEQGIDLAMLWQKKKIAIEQNPGLKIWKGKETFHDMVGSQALKEYGSAIFNGQTSPTFVLFQDEIEKQYAGTSNSEDSTTKEMHGQILSWMADEEILAMLLYGHPGCNKTHFAKVLAGQFNVPLVMLNLSEVKSKYVGESTGQLKNILKTCSAIGRPLLIATSNDISPLSTELKDRFNLGTFFADLPSEEVRKQLWDLYIFRYQLKARGDWDDEGWTGRNIRDCCALAWQLNWTIERASKRIVPVWRSSRDSITARRKFADGKLLSMEYEGVYEIKKKQTVEEGRTITLPPGTGEA